MIYGDVWLRINGKYYDKVAKKKKGKGNGGGPWCKDKDRILLQ